MTFDEWLDERLTVNPIHHTYPIGGMTSDRIVNLLKLVRAQRKLIELALPEGKVVVLGPKSRKVMDEIDALEAALMEGK